MSWPSHDGAICRRALCKAGQDSDGLPQLTDAEKAELNTMSMEQLLVRCTEAGRVFSRGTSCYRGVSWDRSAGKWIARIQLETHYKRLGKFTSEEDAAKAYDRAALVKFGRYIWESLATRCRGRPLSCHCTYLNSAYTRPIVTEGMR